MHLLPLFVFICIYLHINTYKIKYTYNFKYAYRYTQTAMWIKKNRHLWENGQLRGVCVKKGYLSLYIVSRGELDHFLKVFLDYLTTATYTDGLFFGT